MDSSDDEDFISGVRQWEECERMQINLMKEQMKLEKKMKEMKKQIRKLYSYKKRTIVDFLKKLLCYAKVK
jgi:hypothetical protein